MKSPMFGIGEACIIHSIHDYVFAMFFKEFMKWIGISFFDFTYHDTDVQLNEELKKSRFDFILYINDKDNTWKEQYNDLAQVHVDIDMKRYSDDIWCAEKTDESGSVLNASILKDAFREVIKKNFDESSKIQMIFNYLAEVYCKHNVLHKMLDNKYRLSLAYSETFTLSMFLEELEAQSNSWDKIIVALEDKKEIFGKVTGFENYIYALVYSKRKCAEISNFLKKKTPYYVDALIKELDDIYSFSKSFYMGESLKAKVASMNPDSQIMSIFYMANCIEVCPAYACNSFHYYRMGKHYELLNRNDDAWLIYQKAYEKNKLNFRALFKLAVIKINTEKYEEAENYLKLLLRILQLQNTDGELNEENLKYMPVLEMEYACKCFLLLELVTFRKSGNRIKADYYYEEANRVNELVINNQYLKRMYKDDYGCIIERVKSRLSEHVIQKKLRNISGIKN